MLVLNRKAGEEVKIGDDITLTIVRIAANGVRIGITAPKSTQVLRAELVDLPIPEDVTRPIWMPGIDGSDSE